MDEWQEKHFAHFWARMLGIYGKRWIDDHGSEANPSWRDVLKTMSFKKAAATIDVCLNSNDAHPITLSQFVYRARNVRIQPDRPILSLSPPISKEQQLINIRKVKEMIKSTGITK